MRSPLKEQFTIPRLAFHTRIRRTLTAREEKSTGKFLFKGDQLNLACLLNKVRSSPYNWNKEIIKEPSRSLHISS